MRKFFLLLLTQILVSWTWSQTHQAQIAPQSNTFCRGDIVFLEAKITKGSFKYLGTLNGKDYFVDTIPSTWLDSRKKALDNGMDLVSINNQIEGDGVLKLVNNFFKNNLNTVLWIGLSQADGSDGAGGIKSGWTWVDDRLLDTVKYINWATNEPDNNFGFVFPANYAGIGLGRSQPVWFDFPNELPSDFNGYGIAEKISSPISYQWSNSETGSFIIRSASSTFSVTVTVNYDGVDAESPPAIVTVNSPLVESSFDIDVNSNFCLNWNTVSFLNTSQFYSPSSVDYKWDFGDMKTTNVVSPTHAYLGGGEYIVKLTAKDKNGCISESKKTVEILDSPVPPIISLRSGSTIFCEGGSAELTTLVNQVDPLATFVWEKNNSFLANGKTFSATSSGQYNLIVKNSNGCKDTSSISITVNSLPSKPVLSITQGFSSSICSADSINFTAISNSSNLTYLWYEVSSQTPSLLATGSTASQVIFPVSKTSPSVVTEKFSVKIQDQNTCVSAYSDPITITINPSPLVTLTPKTSPTICEGEFVQLDARINPVTSNLQWTKDLTAITGSTATLQAGITGVYRIKATNTAGCSRTSNPITVTVNPFPAIPDVALDPAISFIAPDGTINICTGSSAKFSIASVDNASYQWFRNGTAITNAKSTLYNATTSGTYRVGVTVLNCTSRSADQKVFVISPAAGTLQNPTSTLICNGSTQALSATGSLGYQWYYNAVEISGATSATYEANTPGVYKVEFIDVNGCKRMSPNFVNLSLIQKPTPLFTYDLNCINTRTIFTNQSNSSLSGSVSYLWRFQDGTTSDSVDVSHVFPASGIYKVTLVVTPTACPQLADSLPSNILVEAPTKGINYEPINILINKPVSLIPRLIGDQFKWSPAEGLNNPLIRIPLLTPTKDAKYTVSITNAAGCITTDTVKINIFDEQDVFVAGAFTPNRDGKNDRIYPILVGIDVFVNLRIYNRWGNMIYSSNAIDPNLGWDGTFRGKGQPADTYTWVAEAIGLNGKTIRKSGSLVLIR